MVVWGPRMLGAESWVKLSLGGRPWGPPPLKGDLGSIPGDWDSERGMQCSSLCSETAGPRWPDSRARGRCMTWEVMSKSEMLALNGGLLASQGPGPASCVFTPLWTSCIPRKERLVWPGSHGHRKLQTTTLRVQMNPNPNRPKPNKVTFSQSTKHVSWKPNLTRWTRQLTPRDSNRHVAAIPLDRLGLRQSEKEAYWLILEFLEQEDMPEQMDRLEFLRAVDTLCGAICTQTHGSMNEYVPKTILAKTIETLILKEAGELLTSNVCQQAMLSVVALSHVDPPFHLAQKLDLVNAAISCLFPLPPIAPSLDRKESASLYLQTVQALDDMLQALVMDHLEPDMVTLQKLLEIVLPWLMMSDKEQEQTRAVYTICHLLRFICNFPELLHLDEFSISGRLMGILGIFCMNADHEVSVGASEGLHYLFKLLVLHRSGLKKREVILKDLQKHFRGTWFAYIQDLAMFFRKYLSPEERADVILVLMEAVAGTNENDITAASKILRVVLGSSVPNIGKVPEIVQYIYHNMNSIPEPTAQGTVNKVLQLLAQAYADEVILTLFKLQDQYKGGCRKPWEILASFPQSYEAIMGHLLQRLMLHPRPGDPEPSPRTCITPLLATRAIHELLLQPSRRMEVQALFPPLFTALLSQTSFLVVEGGVETLGDLQQVTKWTDPVSSTIEALKTLIQSTGYGDHVSYVQRLGGWELLSSPERHYEGVTLLARAMVVKNCWHNRPIFDLIAMTLQDPDGRNHLPAFVFITELLRCPDVAATVDDATVHMLASWFHCEEPTTVKLLLRVVEIFRQHGNMTRQLHLLQPYVLNCCYSQDEDIVAETLLVLRGLVDSLRWPQSSSFLVQLTFTLGPFFEVESESLRLAAFEIYSTLLAKVKGTHLVFPLKHQILNLLILLVLHLLDRNVNVVQVCRPALCHAASILDWWRLKAVFSERDVWTILTALLKQEAGKALWFLKQSVTLFKSPQASIRQAAVWFVGQIVQALDTDVDNDIEEASTALKSMREDPDPTVSCLATQTLYIMEAKERLPPRTSTSCLCGRRL